MTVQPIANYEGQLLFYIYTVFRAKIWSSVTASTRCLYMKTWKTVSNAIMPYLQYIGYLNKVYIKVPIYLICELVLYISRGKNKHQSIWFYSFCHYRNYFIKAQLVLVKFKPELCQLKGGWLVYMCVSNVWLHQLVNIILN